MIEEIVARCSIEVGHFRQLTDDMRRMLLSYGFYLASYPLIATFMNAYLWRSGGSIWAIVFYNLGWIIGLPLGFYVNGNLLRRFHILRLYFTGALLQAIIPCLVVFFPVTALVGILGYGLLYGIGSGLFWGNKSFLDMQITRGTNRLYYNSIGTIIDLIANVIIPAAAGWSIVFLNAVYSPESFIAYKAVMIFSFFLLLLSGLVVQGTAVQTIHISDIILRKPPAAWRYIRMFNILHNVQVGVTIIVPNVVVLILVGGEGILGTVQAATAILSSLALYFIGRKSTIGSAWKLIAVGSVVFFLGTAALAGIFSWVGALAYSIVITIAWAFQWPAASSVTMELLDHAEPNPEKQYAYISDNELYYNVGRALGMSIVVLSAIFFSQNAALRWSPVIVGALQLPLGWTILKISQLLPSPAPAATSASPAA